MTLTKDYLPLKSLNDYFFCLMNYENGKNDYNSFHKRENHNYIVDFWNVFKFKRTYFTGKNDNMS